MQTKISWINIDIILTYKLNCATQNMLETLKNELNTKEVTFPHSEDGENNVKD